MSAFLNSAVALCTAAAGKVIVALLVFLIGRIIIRKLIATLTRLKAFTMLEPTVRSFLANFVNIGLYVILVIAIISVLGVPMASVITVLASAGVAVGLALQGALSNLAGGIMLLIFRPFGVGDYVSSAGEEGVVKEITLFYTVLTTVDNRRITVPNGALMNANVTNFSAEPTRRVDLTFSCAKGEDIEKIRSLMIKVMSANEKVLADPAPFAELSGGTNESMEFTTRAWCSTADYWDVYFELINQISHAMGEAGIQAPAVRVITESK